MHAQTAEIAASNLSQPLFLSLSKKNAAARGERLPSQSQSTSGAITDFTTILVALCLVARLLMAQPCSWLGIHFVG
jgi:hypothetical protein